MTSLWNAFTRKKRNESSDESELARVLNLFDLTALGVGSTLGLGIYVLAGSVAYEQAGPAVVISFLIAAVASAISGLCYAEFAARVPKAGSAYVYCYVSVGEFVAFTIGWNLILEYVIGTSSVARGMSGYIDALIDNKMGKFWRDLLPMNMSFLADYPDFFSFVIVMILAIILAIGVEESSLINKIFTVVNFITIMIVLVAGCIKADPANWSIPKENIPSGIRGGEGGFMPYGMAGVMAGAAKCFYGFVGFDCVATTGEEAKNPKRNIPLAIVISLIIIFLAYFLISTVLTMMLPYYMQDPIAPFPRVYQELGWTEVKWIVSIGATFALCTSLLGAMFPLPRVLYAMSSDGIIYSFMKKVHPRTQTPLIATMLSGLVAAVMATIFDLHQLVNMMSIGTLLAYTIVAVCVLVLHYDASGYISEPEDVKATRFKTILKQVVNLNVTTKPNKLSSDITKVSIIIFSLLATAFSLLFILNIDVIVVSMLSIVGAGMLLTMLIICRQPKDENIKPTFKVPFVPLLPCLSILMNIYLMVQLDFHTWIRFGVWLLLGYLIYFTYGIKNSKEGELQREDNKLTDQKQAILPIPTS